MSEIRPCWSKGCCLPLGHEGLHLSGALTREEWTALKIYRDPSSEADAVWEAGIYPSRTPPYLVSDPPDCLALKIGVGIQWNGTADRKWCYPSESERHALAALCLHEQPFGFTQQDVAMLRQEADDEWPASHEMHAALTNLADRIAALLPPVS